MTNESLGLIISILSLFATIYAIYYSKILITQKNELTIFHQQFEAKPVPDTDLEIHHYQATLTNSGETEIYDTHFKDDLELKLQESIVQMDITAQSPDRLKIIKQIKPDAVLFKWDMMRPNEYFRFHITSQGKPQSCAHFFKSIQADSRIKGIRKINLIDENQLKANHRQKRSKIWLLLSVITLIGVATPLYYGILYKFQPLRNLPPEIYAITLPANSITLPGISSDPDTLSITAYSWSKISGPSALQASQVVHTNSKQLDSGAYIFELKVLDSSGKTTTTPVTVKLNPGIHNPGAFALKNIEGENIALVLTNSDISPIILYASLVILVAGVLLRIALQHHYMSRMRIVLKKVNKDF